MKAYLLSLALTLVGMGSGHLLAAKPSTVAIPDDGWRLWPDTQAPWKDDALYLPDEVDLTKLPVNAPTGGWDALGEQAGVAVSLPATVEQYFWGQFGLRPYTGGEYFYGGADKQPQNGNYKGV